MALSHSPNTLRRYASAREIPCEFTHLGSGLYKSAHALWELRAAEDDRGGYILVRKFEERAVDMRKDARSTTVVSKRPVARHVQQGSQVFVVRQGQVMSATVTMTMDNGQAKMDFGHGDVEVMPESSIVDILDDSPCSEPCGEGEAMLEAGMDFLKEFGPPSPQIIEETVELICTPEPESWLSPGVDIGRASDLVSLEPTIVRGPEYKMDPPIEPSSKAAGDLQDDVDVTVVQPDRDHLVDKSEHSDHADKPTSQPESKEAGSEADPDSKHNAPKHNLDEHNKEASMFSLSSYLINRWRRVMAHYQMTADLDSGETGLGPNFGESLIVDKPFTYENPYNTKNKITFKPGRQFEYDGLEQDERGEPVHRLTDGVTGQQIFLSTHMLEPNFSLASDPERAPDMRTDAEGSAYRVLREDEEDSQGPDMKDEREYFKNMPWVPVGDEESDAELERAYGKDWVDKVKGRNQPARVRPLRNPSPGAGRDFAQAEDPSFNSAPTTVKPHPARNLTTPAGPRGMGTGGTPMKAAAARETTLDLTPKSTLDDEFGEVLASKEIPTGWLDLSVVSISDLV